MFNQNGKWQVLVLSFLLLGGSSLFLGCKEMPKEISEESRREPKSEAEVSPRIETLESLDESDRIAMATNNVRSHRNEKGETLDEYLEKILSEAKMMSAKMGRDIEGSYFEWSAWRKYPHRFIYEVKKQQMMASGVRAVDFFGKTMQPDIFNIDLVTGRIVLVVWNGNPQPVEDNGEPYFGKIVILSGGL